MGVLGPGPTITCRVFFHQVTLLSSQMRPRMSYARRHPGRRRRLPGLYHKCLDSMLGRNRCAAMDCLFSHQVDVVVTIRCAEDVQIAVAVDIASLDRTGRCQGSRLQCALPRQSIAGGVLEPGHIPRHRGSAEDSRRRRHPASAVRTKTAPLKVSSTSCGSRLCRHHCRFSHQAMALLVVAARGYPGHRSPFMSAA